MINKTIECCIRNWKKKKLTVSEQNQEEKVKNPVTIEAQREKRKFQRRQ